MEKERLAYLLDRYEKGLCSVAEQAALENFYGALGTREDGELPGHIPVHVKDYVSRKYRKLKAITDRQE